jgi:hypothetical protein
MKTSYIKDDPKLSISQFRCSIHHEDRIYNIMEETSRKQTTVLSNKFPADITREFYPDAFYIYGSLKDNHSIKFYSPKNGTIIVKWYINLENYSTEI